MKFVTKKEYEDACAILQKAINNKQIVHVDAGYRESENVPMRAAVFLNECLDVYNYNQLTFLAPEIAIKNNLHELRNQIKLQKERYNTKQKELEELEAQEKQLASELALSKE